MLAHGTSLAVSPSNRISLLARGITTLKNTEGTSVDSFSLAVTKAFARFHAESTRPAPVKQESKDFTWAVS